MCSDQPQKSSLSLFLAALPFVAGHQEGQEAKGEEDEKWKTIQDEQKAKRDEKQKKRRTNLKERTGEFPSGAFCACSCLF